MFSFITETAVGRLLTCGVHQPQYALSLFRAVLGYVCVKDRFLFISSVGIKFYLCSRMLHKKHFVSTYLSSCGLYLNLTTRF